jgi:hypothetical protein
MAGTMRPCHTRRAMAICLLISITTAPAVRSGIPSPSCVAPTWQKGLASGALLHLPLGENGAGSWQRSPRGQVRGLGFLIRPGEKSGAGARAGEMCPIVRNGELKADLRGAGSSPARKLVRKGDTLALRLKGGMEEPYPWQQDAQSRECNEADL